MTTSAGHVFISHGSDDRDEAAELCAFIEARGIRTWIAPRDVRPGQDYSEQLQQAIEQCAAFVVLVSGKANSSPFVRAETEMAFSTGKPIFPVRQSEIQPAPGLAFFLKIRHWTDAFGKHGDAAMERLGLELDAVCGTPTRTAETSAPPETSDGAARPTAASPASRSPSGASESPPPPPAEQEQRMRAAIGPNADSYLAKWRKMEADRSALSWNWPAFLANLFWLAYRKMWLPLAVAVVLFLLAAFFAGRAPANVAPAWLFLLVLAGLNGAIGNALYRRQVKRLVARADGLDQPVALAQIGAQGGISVPGLATTLGIFLLLFIASTVTQMNRMRANAPQPVGERGGAGRTAGRAKPARPDRPERARAAGGRADARCELPARPLDERHRRRLQQHLQQRQHLHRGRRQPRLLEPGGGPAGADRQYHRGAAGGARRHEPDDPGPGGRLADPRHPLLIPDRAAAAGKDRAFVRRAGHARRR